MVEFHDTAPLRPTARVRKTMKLAGLASERDFYKYYPRHPKPYDFLARQPSPSPTPPTVETDFPCLPADAGPRPSEDLALTAFAQLGALRLNARRCLISFFDRRNCYILAEGTRTTCLQDGKPEFEEDSLCFGTSVFAKEMSLCHYTVNLNWGDAPLPLGSLENHPSLVVSDLSKDPRFQDYPFVAGPPYSRFYAGVPIRSPSGHSIGTYCVLDDKPREGLRPHELIFLKNMAGTIMQHLQMSRATEYQRRGKMMVKSLGSFAEGKSSTENWWADPWESGIEPPMSVTSQEAKAQDAQDAHNPTDVEPTIPDIQRIGSVESSEPNSASPKPLSPSSVLPTSTAITPATEVLPEIRHEVVAKSSSTQEGGKDRVAPELRATFDRAANMMVDAVEADGAVFFDAKISSFGGLVDDDFSELIPEPDKPCAILGAGFCKNNRDYAVSKLEMTMSESVLRHLLRTYPNGQIFNLDDDLTSPAVNSPSGAGDADVSEGFPFQTIRKAESMQSMDDVNYLRTIFPKAKSLALYPLYDSHRDRWFACSFIWSIHALRVFTNEQELSYLAAFSNSVMAEVARLDTKLADAAKADFISSISHELRSPLHGILGMTDLLKDTSIDPQQISHVATIETCGKTLLETINHVLDFAKINNLTRGTSKRQKKRTASMKHMISSGQAHTNDIMTLINDVDMAILTEDVVESVFAGYLYQKTSAQTYELSSKKTNRPPVCIILDINQSANYVFRTQPGAWRRVIMNLFGNAVKYTERGYIKVKLEVKSMHNEDECYEFRFTVTDSGIGMSEDYVNNRLFHSFAQENSLSQGTGLGLSIVKQIVDSLNGEVEVRSAKGRGTKFTVTCPLKASVLSPSITAAGLEQEKAGQLVEVARRTKGMRVQFGGFNDVGDYFVKDLKNKNATRLSLKALESLCTDWFGMRSHGEAGQVDVIVATETYAKVLRTHHSTSPEESSIPPVIVICQGPAAAQSTTAITIPGIIFECISQPVGPHKMTKALASCLDRYADRISAQTSEAETTLLRVNDLSLKENSVPQRPILTSRLSEPTRPQLISASSAPEIRPLDSKSLRKSLYEKPTRSLNCLCVDDNPINLRLLRTFVAKLGHHHILATDGVEALEAYKSSSLASADSCIDVILMDINMPRMDGLEATRQIRAHELRNNLPKVTIIALTGVADSEIQQEANSSGINLFLIKPVRLADLEVVLKGVITGQDTAKLELAQEKNKDDEQHKTKAVSDKDGTHTAKQVPVILTSEIKGVTEEDSGFAHPPQASQSPEQPVVGRNSNTTKNRHL